MRARYGDTGRLSNKRKRGLRRSGPTFVGLQLTPAPLGRFHVTRPVPEGFGSSRGARFRCAWLAPAGAAATFLARSAGQRALEH